MANPAVSYRIIGVAPGRVIEAIHAGAPSESWLLDWGKRRRVSFVIRYFPSRKGWRVLDLRCAQCFVNVGRRRSIWTGQVRGKRYFLNSDAAVMFAAMQLGYTPTPT